jgi:hypothetical protein
MEESANTLGDVIAHRLLAKAEKPLEEQEVKQLAGEPLALAGSEKSKSLTSTEFTKIEKNLAALGFFTPSTKRIKNAKSKTVTFTKIIDGKRIEVTATFVPGALYGLPITSDQDKYLAFYDFLSVVQQREGEVKNPIGFSSADFVKLLSQHRRSGKNYKDVSEWLDVMTATTIVSEGAVYLAGKKKFATDRFHVFDRAISIGTEMPDGTVADKNYVWLSEWQLENLNNNYLVPIDYTTYRKLKLHIAKALVPLLQVWLYASRKEGRFEKMYDEFCEILSIRQYQHLSKIKEKLGPSLDELKTHGYLAKWNVERSGDWKRFKIIFYHGEKFFRDLGLKQQELKGIGGRGGATEQAPVEALSQPVLEAGRQEQTDSQKAAPEANPLLSKLVTRGIPKEEGEKILNHIAPTQPLEDQIEYFDFLLSQGKIRENPAGWLAEFIRKNYRIPDSFEPSWVRKQRQAEQEAQQQRIKQWQAQEEAKQKAIDRKAEEALKALPAEQYQALYTQVKTKILTRFPGKYKEGPMLDGYVKSGMLIQLRQQERVHLLRGQQGRGGELVSSQLNPAEAIDQRNTTASTEPAYAVSPPVSDETFTTTSVLESEGPTNAGEPTPPPPTATAGRGEGSSNASPQEAGAAVSKPLDRRPE